MRTITIIFAMLASMTCFAQDDQINLIATYTTLEMKYYSNDLLFRNAPVLPVEIAKISDQTPAGWRWHFKTDEPIFGHKDLWILPGPVLVGIATEAVQDLGKSGRICEVYGHQWRDGRPGETVVEGYGHITTQLRYADYHPNTNFRTCKICGTCQRQELDWK